MAPVTFRLIALNSTDTKTSFLEAIKAAKVNDRPVYVGACQHWIHEPHLSAEALTGNGSIMQRWDYLIVTRGTSGPAPLPIELAPFVEKDWSITAHVDDQQLDGLADLKRQLLTVDVPILSSGWSPDDSSGLMYAEVPSDLEISLAVSSYALGSDRSGDNRPIGLKDFVQRFGKQHTGPVDMFNLLSYLPNGRPQYFKYIAAFTESVGSKYGGAPLLAGLGGIVDWSSKSSENLQAGVGWEDTAVVNYPSIWHFAKMLDDPDYMAVDRSFKQGALRDNPLICCTEIELFD